MARVLIVEDEQSISWALGRLCEAMGNESVRLPNAEDGLEYLQSNEVDLIILDVRLPAMSGLDAIDEIRREEILTPIIVITAFGDLTTAVDAIRKGAFEYIVKPFEIETMELVIERALESSQTLAAEDSRLHSKLPASGLVGDSISMQEVYKQIALAAASNTGVLLFGESGTGKELAARAIHHHSSRRDEPFVAVNVAALSPTLIESELFGHAKGAFTGADSNRNGLLLQANGGTLFLDEVADIPESTQVRLLRALDYGEVTPVGSATSQKTDFRIIAATHRDLAGIVKDGGFRHDLYFRLGAFQIKMPPLRERPDDIAELADHFLVRITGGADRTTRFSEDAISDLRSREWFGNVRELRNAIEYAVTVARHGVIGKEHFPATSISSPNHRSSKSTDDVIVEAIRQWAKERISNPGTTSTDLHQELITLVEKPLIEVVFDACRGQFSAAGRCLGMHRTTLKKKIDEL